MPIDTLDHLAHVHDLRSRRLATGERRQPASEIDRPARGDQHLLGVPHLDPGVACVSDHDLGVAEDAHQHVVEVVGDAAREAAQRLHLLRVAELRLQREAVGQVGDDRDHAG